MLQVVKEYIDVIDEENWTQLFNNWYLQCSSESRSDDYDNLAELFKVFNSVGIDLYKDSEYARKQIIAEYMYEYIDDVLSTDPTRLQIALPEVIKQLNSKLDISLIELNNIFKQVGQHIQGSFDVRLEPFKIVRN